MENIPNIRVFKIKYLGPTNTRRARVKIIDERFKKSKTIDFDFQYNDISNIAKNYLEKKGIYIIY